MTELLHLVELAMHLFSGMHTLDLLLIILGFSAGFMTRLKTPIYLTIFMIRMIKWWMDTHPSGKEISEKTNFDEEFDKIFGTNLHKYDGQVPGEAEVDKL